MTKKKNGFFTFICSLIPGAGEMYLGFMKEGVSIMSLAFILFGFAACINIEPVLFLIPIIWFYSFFNVHNKACLSDEEFYALEDRYLFHLDQLIPDSRLSGRQRTVFGWIMILLGICIIWKSTISGFLAALRIFISEEFVNMIERTIYMVPQYIISIVLIVCGIRLIQNKKKELEENY